MGQITLTVKAIFLDLDDTLLDNRKATRVGFEAFLGANQKLVDQASHSDIFNAWKVVTRRHWRRHEANEISFEDQRRCRVREFLNISLSDNDADLAFEPYLNAYEAAWELLPGVLKFLSETRGIPKFIVTNGDRQQQLRKVSATGLSEYIDGVVTPVDCGYWKPQPEIFMHALKLAGVSATGCLMVGDQDDRDLAPARQLGMRSCLLDPDKSEQIFAMLIEQ